MDNGRAGGARPMNRGQWTVDNERPADRRSIVYFPLSTLSAVGRPPPPPPRGIRGHPGTYPTPPWLHSVAFGGVADAGEQGSGSTGSASSRRACSPQAREWELAGGFWGCCQNNMKRPVRNPTPADEVPTPAGKVPTFSRHLERFSGSVGRRNRDIRLETRVSRSGDSGAFGT